MQRTYRCYGFLHFRYLSEMFGDTETENGFMEAINTYKYFAFRFGDEGVTPSSYSDNLDLLKVMVFSGLYHGQSTGAPM